VFREDINKVYVLAVKRTLRERWAEDIDVFKFQSINKLCLLIKFTKYTL